MHAKVNGKLNYKLETNGVRLVGWPSASSAKLLTIAFNEITQLLLAGVRPSPRIHPGTQIRYRFPGKSVCCV